MKISSFRVALSLAAVFAAAFSAKAQFTKLNAAGSTFAALIMQRWSGEFSRVNPNIQVIYFAVGSGTGITNFTEGSVDLPPRNSRLTEVRVGIVQKVMG